MNRFNGHITGIRIHGSLSLVSVQVGENTILKSIVIETPQSADWLKMNNPVKVLFKETEVVIATGDHHSISLQNRIKGSITGIEKGVLISRVMVDSEAGRLISVISSNAVEQLQLVAGMNVTAMVKLNEIMLSE